MGELQYHIRCKPGDVGDVVLLPGDPGRVESIARLLDRPRLIARNREYTTYTGELDGRAVSVCSTGIGSPSSARRTPRGLPSRLACLRDWARIRS